MSDSSEQYLILDPEKLKQRKLHNRRWVYVKDIPIRRLVGNVMIIIGVLIHKILSITDAGWPEVFLYLAIIVAYNLVSFLLVYFFLDKTGPLNIAELFLIIDPILQVYAIYVSGDVRSLFFILLITRTADHVFVSFKKTVLYNHLSIFIYCCMLLYLVFVEGRTINGPVEFLKVFIVYCVNWYISAVARMPDALKSKLKNIINAGQNELQKRIRAEEMLQEKNRNLEQLNLALQDSMENIRTLHGLLPICASCKKIRDDKGYWNQLESYIEKYSEVEFSHSVCPECADKLYGKYDWYQKRKEKGGFPEGPQDDKK